MGAAVAQVAFEDGELRFQGLCHVFGDRCDRLRD